MAYHNRNRLKYLEFVVSIYLKEKQPDVPDTYIVRHVFPRYKIYMSYRKWMMIKNMKISELNPVEDVHNIS